MSQNPVVTIEMEEDEISVWDLIKKENRRDAGYRFRPFYYPVRVIQAVMQWGRVDLGEVFSFWVLLGFFECLEQGLAFGQSLVKAL